METSRRKIGIMPTGNREIFLLDYAQRRIFQLRILRTFSRLCLPTADAQSERESNAHARADPADPTLVQIEISNNRPMISFEPALVFR